MSGTTISTTAPEPTRPGSPSTRRRQEKIAVRVIAGVAAVAATLAGCEPTGTVVVDPLLTGSLAALVTLAASRSKRWPWFVPVGVAIVLARGWALAPAMAATLTSLVGSTTSRRSRLWGATTGGLAIQALLRLPDIGFHGFTALATAVAITPVLVSGYQTCRRSERRRIRRAVLAGGAVVAVIGLAYGALLLSVATDIDRATSDAQTGLNATRRGDTDTARRSFVRAESSFERTNSRINGWWAAPARAVPVLSQHARALGSSAEEGVQLSRTAGETVEAANYQELRSTGGQFDIDRIVSVRDPLERTATSISSAQRAIDANRTPWLLGPLADGLDDLGDELTQAGGEADLALDAVEVAPALLGADGPRHYFVAFVTPAELRGSGGFMGSYAEISATDGRLRLEESGSTRELRQARGAVEVTGPPDYIRRYGQFSVGDFIGDFTFSPHFPYDAQVISEIYPQAGGRPVDGVISIDPIALAALLRFTGPVEVEGFGRTLSADDAANFLLRENYALFQDNDAQNDALAELVEITFDRLTTGDLPGPRRIGDILGPATAEGRIRLWSPDSDEQALFGRLGATGAFPEPRPGRDFLAVASQNSGNNKIDVYQSRDIDYRVTIDDEGALRATARVTVRNDAPLDQRLPDYVLSNSQDDPEGTNRMLLSVYTPHELEGAAVDGEATGVQSETEAGYRVYTKQIVVPPGGSVTLELDLVGTMDLEGDYHLDLAPQPTVVSDQLTVRAGRSDAPPTAVEPFDITGRDELIVAE